MTIGNRNAFSYPHVITMALSVSCAGLGWPVWESCSLMHLNIFVITPARRSRWRRQIRRRYTTRCRTYVTCRTGPRVVTVRQVEALHVRMVDAGAQMGVMFSGRRYRFTLYFHGYRWWRWGWGSAAGHRQLRQTVAAVCQRRRNLMAAPRYGAQTHVGTHAEILSPERSQRTRIIRQSGSLQRHDGRVQSRLGAIVLKTTINN